MGRFESEFAALRALSARAGRDRLLVQGAGGNTSIKDGGILRIKASGTWLADAEVKDIFVPVYLDPLLAALESGSEAAENTAPFVVSGHNPQGLRPSIETSVHAVIPSRVVVHVHCVETIARAVRTDAEETLSRLMPEGNWILLPYRRPGLPLARAILERQRQCTRIYILGNHGLVVAGESVAEAAALLEKVRGRLASPVRQAPAADPPALQALATGSGYEAAADAGAHGVATDAVSLEHARGGSLYPDHVIFLGAGCVIARADENALQVRNRVVAAGLPEPVSILFPGLGVVLRKGATAEARAMACCLSDVTARIAQGAALNYLTQQDHAALLNWDAEKYRQQLALSGVRQ